MQFLITQIPLDFLKIEFTYSLEDFYVINKETS